MEPSALLYAERHDNIEAIYKKLTERRDTADVTALLKELHRIVNEAIRSQKPMVADPRPDGKFYDLSAIDLEKLRDEFARKVKRKASVLQDIREIVEQKLADMLKHNPMRMDYYKRYQEIIADYNREKDRVTIEETFAKLVELAASLDEEQRKAVEEGLSEEEYALFSLLLRDDISKADRERLKLPSRDLLNELQKCWPHSNSGRRRSRRKPRWRYSFSTTSISCCRHRHSQIMTSRRRLGRCTAVSGTPVLRRPL